MFDAPVQAKRLGLSCPQSALRFFTCMSAAMRIHPEVADALRRGAAVVALESTIISHGASALGTWALGL
jgi:hypothetical protein